MLSQAVGSPPSSRAADLEVTRRRGLGFAGDRLGPVERSSQLEVSEKHARVFRAEPW